MGMKRSKIPGGALGHAGNSFGFIPVVAFLAGENEAEIRKCLSLLRGSGGAHG